MVNKKNQHQQSAQQVSGKQKPSLTRRIVRYTAYMFGSLLILGLAAVMGAAAYIAKIEPTTPGIDGVRAMRNAQPSILLSASGTRLATFSRSQQQQVTLDKISPYVVQALIATEDHRFYEHQGIDISRTLAAAFRTLNGEAQGGSTITQQMVRNIFPEEIGRSRTIERKLREMITAVKVERAYSKEEILETYLNTVPFLYNAAGIEMAARTYYDKPAAALNVLESATLIGMLKGTSYYNPIINPERALKRRNVVLGQMVRHGMLTAAQFQAMRDQPLQVKFTRQSDPPSIAPHFAAYARRFLTEWAQQHGYNIYTDGLVIESTIDDALQLAATEAVAREAQILQDIADVEWGQSASQVASHTPGTYASLRRRVEPFQHFWRERHDLIDTFIRETPEYRKAIAGGRKDEAVLARLKADTGFMARLRAAKTRLEAGFVAIEPFSGEIKAWVGSRDFGIDQFDHVAQAERQPGSTFKPIVYGAALEQGLRPDHAYTDRPVAIPLPNGSVWRPADMSGISGRRMSMRDGLIYSKNTITAQVMQDAGLENVIGLARAAGVKQSKLDPVPSLALGTSPVTLLEMAAAYSTIAQVGEYRKPVFIKRITDRHGNVLAEFSTQGTQVMSEDTAVELIDMMRGVIRRGTGTAVKTHFGILADIAGKTGTTQNNTDGWFILMHPNLVAGAWVGFNDSRVTMRSDYWGQGGHNAILLVGDFFRSTLAHKLIDVNARFPLPKPSLPLVVNAQDDGSAAQDVDNRENNLPPGYGTLTRSDGSTIVIAPGDMRTVQQAGESYSNANDELGRFLGDLGRDNVGTTGDTQ